MLYCSGCLLFRVRESRQEIRTESSRNLAKSGLDAEEPQKNRNESNSTGFYLSFLLIGEKKVGNNLGNLYLMICLISPPLLFYNLFYCPGHFLCFFFPLMGNWQLEPRLRFAPAAYSDLLIGLTQDLIGAWSEDGVHVRYRQKYSNSHRSCLQTSHLGEKSKIPKWVIRYGL